LNPALLFFYLRRGNVWLFLEGCPAIIIIRIWRKDKEVIWITFFRGLNYDSRQRRPGKRKRK
ncbi:unnamed protein product, partial [Amoebophrya sp. A120]